MTSINRYKWRIIVSPDSDPDTSFLEQEEFEERLALYRRGDFAFVGVYAEAHDWTTGVTARSAGLWGIESDSGDDYMREIGIEECGEVAKALGIPAPNPTTVTLVRCD